MKRFFAIAIFGVGVLGACFIVRATLARARAGSETPTVAALAASAPIQTNSQVPVAPLPTPGSNSATPTMLPPSLPAPSAATATAAETSQAPTSVALPPIPGPTASFKSDDAPVPPPAPLPGSSTLPAVPGASNEPKSEGLPVPPPLPMPGSSPAPSVPQPATQPKSESVPVAPPVSPAGPGGVLPATEPASTSAPVVPVPAGLPAAPQLPTSGQAVTPVPAPMPATASTNLPMSEEQTLEATVSPPNPTGRQEPAVSIEWVGPPTAKVGQPADYILAVRNACNIPVQQVLVRVRVPAGMTAAATEPKAVCENNVLVWELGTLLAKQEKNLQMKLVADTKGDVMPQAWVTFTGSSVMQVKIREPKLTLKTSAPEKVMVGDAAAFTLTVSNPGDGVADQVKIHAVLSDGLEHARGNKIDFEIGNLAAGETRSVQLICATKAGGPQKCEGIAEAEGNLKASDLASVNVIMPRLDVQLAGPALRYLERKALYTLKVSNPGDAAASNVTVSDVVPPGFKVLAASDGGRHDFSTRTVSWFLGEIGPGQTREVKLEVQAINPGEFKHKAMAVAARGLRSQAELMTRVEGLSALLMEMVDTEDPIEVNGDTAYEIRITNTGSKTETDIKIVATIPDKMEFKSAQGPARFHQEGKTIVFEPIENLAPRADAIFRINVKAVDPGTVRFKVQMTSTNLVEPVVKMEATRIYSDAPDAKPIGN